MYKKTLSTSLVIVTVVAISIFYYVLTLHNRDTTRTNNATMDQNAAVLDSKEHFQYKNVGNNGLLTLPFISTTLKIPAALFTLTADDITALNTTGNSLSLDCRTLYKETRSHNGLWVSFAAPSELCGTDRSFSLVNDQIFQGDVSSICNKLSDATLYQKCGEIFHVSPEFDGIVFYEFIPDYVDNKVGTVAKTWYIVSTSSATTRLLVSYIPGGPSALNIRRSDFSKVVDRMLRGGNADLHSYEEEMPLVQSVISSASRSEN